jgi:choline dehydrogenase
MPVPYPAAWLATHVRYDALVLGGGSAGCVLAARLSEDENRTVCLVEAGPDYGPRSNWPTELLDPGGIPESHQWDPQESPHTPLRAKVIGGCSTHNACLLVWPPDADPELEPFLRRALDTIAPEPFFHEEVTPWFGAVAEAAAAHGFEVLNGPFNVRDGVRWNAAFAYLDPARGRPNLTIRANTFVERVVVEDERAVGAIVDGETLEADVVVLSAGAIGSPRILLRSGIEAGGNLQEHVTAKLVFDVTDELRSEEPLPFTNGILRNDDLHLLPVVDRYGEQAHVTVALLQPASRGRLGLDAIDHNLLGDERDRRALADGLELAREIAEHDALRRLGRPADAEPTLGIYFHPVGTCANVQRLENLHIADASVLDPIPRANTHLASLAVAEKLASEL